MHAILFSCNYSLCCFLYWLSALLSPLLPSIQLDDAKTDDDIDKILDQPASMLIINQSQWSIVEPVTTSNKSSLIQHLIWEEVIQRRDQNIQAFKRGPKQFKMVELIQKHPDMLKPLFVAQPSQEITAGEFWSLVASLKPSAHEHQRASAIEYFR